MRTDVWGLLHCFEVREGLSWPPVMGTALSLASSGSWGVNGMGDEEKQTGDRQGQRHKVSEGH